jgi:hypothetical protein
VIALVVALALAGDDVDAARAAETRAFAAVDDLRFCDAVNAFEDAFDAKPDVDYLLNASKVAAKANDFDRARSLAGKAVSLAPDRAKQIGAELVKLGDKKSTQRCPQRVAAAPPSTSESTPATPTIPAPPTATTATTATTPTMSTTPTTPTTPARPPTATTSSAPATPTTPTTPTPPSPPSSLSGTPLADGSRPPEAGTSPVFVGGAIALGVGASAALFCAAGMGWYDYELRQPGGSNGVSSETKTADLALRDPILIATVSSAVVAAAGGVAMLLAGGP